MHVIQLFRNIDLIKLIFSHSFNNTLKLLDLSVVLDNLSLRIKNNVECLSTYFYKGGFSIHPFVSKLLLLISVCEPPLSGQALGFI